MRRMAFRVARERAPRRVIVEAPVARMIFKLLSLGLVR